LEEARIQQFDRNAKADGHISRWEFREIGSAKSDAARPIAMTSMTLEELLAQVPVSEPELINALDPIAPPVRCSSDGCAAFAADYRHCRSMIERDRSWLAASPGDTARHQL
jgi:hypothetical protein